MAAGNLFAMIGHGARRAASVAVLLLAVSGLRAAASGGKPAASRNPEIATHAADAFLRALADHDVDGAWNHLTPATRRIVYDDDKMAFARDVAASDWSGVSWEFGPVTNLDWAWGVHVVIDETGLPTFPVERQIAAGWKGSGIVLHVVAPDDQTHLIAAQGVG
jgi:hypothetical protein